MLVNEVGKTRKCVEDYRSFDQWVVGRGNSTSSKQWKLAGDVQHALEQALGKRNMILGGAATEWATGFRISRFWDVKEEGNKPTRQQLDKWFSKHERKDVDPSIREAFMSLKNSYSWASLGKDKQEKMKKVRDQQLKYRNKLFKEEFCAAEFKWSAPLCGGCCCRHGIQKRIISTALVKNLHQSCQAWFAVLDWWVRTMISASTTVLLTAYMASYTKAACSKPVGNIKEMTCSWPVAPKGKNEHSKGLVECKGSGGND